VLEHISSQSLSSKPVPISCCDGKVPIHSPPLGYSIKFIRCTFEDFYFFFSIISKNSSIISWARSTEKLWNMNRLPTLLDSVSTFFNLAEVLRFVRMKSSSIVDLMKTTSAFFGFRVERAINSIGSSKSAEKTKRLSVDVQTRWSLHNKNMTVVLETSSHYPLNNGLSFVLEEFP